MYCPNCATEALADQKFCRVCGMELQAVAELVGTQTGLRAHKHREAATLQPRDRALIIWGFILTFGAAGVGAALKILGRDNVHPAGEFTPYISVIAVLLAFFGMGLMSYPFLQMMSPRRKPLAISRTKTETTATTERKLLQQEPPSVTDQTTELLDVAESRLNVRDTAPGG